MAPQYKTSQIEMPVFVSIGLLALTVFSSSAFGFRTGPIVSSSPKRIQLRFPLTQLYAAESSPEVFKGGLFADEFSQERAAELVSEKIRTVSDLGWKEKEARRPSRIRPKLWPFGGDSELAIQDKANYSPKNPNCPDPWLGLQDFYLLLNDDTAAADLIFVALAGGRAFVERSNAEAVLDRWWGTGGAMTVGTRKPKRNQKRQFDRLAFEQTVKTGQRDFIAAWSSFLGLTGFAAAGILFPNNPFQLALVDLIDTIF